MNSTGPSGAVTSPLAPAHSSVDDLFAAEMDLWSTDELLDNWRDLERLLNRLPAVGHLFVAQAERRNLHVELGAKNTAALIRGLLRVDPHEASARVRAADAAVGRVALTGEPTQAPFPAVAAAQAAGSISPRHAKLVVQSVEKLPGELQVSDGAVVEHDLVGLAMQFDPSELGKLADRMTTLLDQDGALQDIAYREKHREFVLHRRSDGSSSVGGELTAEATELVSTVFDALAKPKPAIDGTRDPRSAGQRNHDALLDALTLVARAELLPDAGGVTTTVLLTTTAEAWAGGTGVATTGHGGVLPVPEAIRIAGGNARVMTVELDTPGAVTGWTDARRLFTEGQRLAMTARDGGCTFPGCDAPPAWCQSAHIIDHACGGPTTIANGTLLCGHHHRNYDKLGWRVVSQHGTPAWIPPPWLDPALVPRRNPHHQPR